MVTRGVHVSMLARYKKAGGFLQLLNLMETTAQPKRDKFMELIRAEDPRWGRAIEQKMISFDRIMGWDDNSVSEIAATLQDLTLAVLGKVIAAPQKEKLFKMLGHSRNKKIDELAATLNPTPAEVATMYNKFLSETRKMIKEGYIHLNRIDPGLLVDDEIEAKLANGSLDLGAAPAEVAAAASGSSRSSSSSSVESSESGSGEAPALRFDDPTSRIQAASAAGGTAELGELRKKVESLQKELTMARHEASVMRTKLEQIKKIA